MDFMDFMDFMDSFSGSIQSIASMSSITPAALSSAGLCPRRLALRGDRQRHPRGFSASSRCRASSSSRSRRATSGCRAETS